MSYTDQSTTSSKEILNTSVFIQGKLSNFIRNIRHSALLEILGFLLITLLIDILIGKSNRFIDMAPHPFWVIVLLVTVQYGPMEALIASLFASAFLLIGNMPEQFMTETIYEYILRLIYLPLLWILTSLILGSIRARQLRDKKGLQERLEKSERATHILTENYQTLKQSKEQLELRLASERCSVLTMYDVAKSLESTDTTDMRSAIVKLVTSAINPTKFSLYHLDGNMLRLELMHGWKKSDNFMIQFDVNTPLAKSILEKKHPPLSIVNAEDEEILKGQGMLAGPIVNKKTGKVFGILKVEEINFMDLGIRMHETFHIVCEWIAQVYTNAEKFQTLQDKEATPEPTTNVSRIENFSKEDVSLKTVSHVLH